MAELTLGERADRALSFPGQFTVGIAGSEAVGLREANEIVRIVPGLAE